MKLLITLTALVLATATSARAGTDKSQVAEQLGNLLGSEEACGLAYNHEAIEAFIRERIPPADLDFPALLQTHTWLAHLGIKDMSESSLVAHCYQIRQLAYDHMRKDQY